jgi:hypothetical protein
MSLANFIVGLVAIWIIISYIFLAIRYRVVAAALIEHKKELEESKDFNRELIKTVADQVKELDFWKSCTAVREDISDEFNGFTHD